jgi:dynein heavy chain
MLERAKELLASLPAQFDMVAVNAKYRIDYFESMNTVLIQELLRYNNLLSVLVNSLRDLIKAAQGLVVMSQELDRIGEAILNNMLPASWKAKSYPSLKPLVNYWSDLNTRIEMFRKWIAEGPP